jgi:hypothetical protein
MKDLQESVSKFLNDLTALPEEKMRVELLGRRLKELGPTGAAAFLHTILSMPDADPVRKAKSVMVDPEVIRSSVGSVFYREVYLASIDAGYNRVSRFFTDLPAHRTGPYGYDKEEEAKMESLTLGERRALSKSLLRDKLSRLLSDPDPTVVGNLLDNPKITEREVLKIASKRPNSPRILKIIAVHRVWSRRYDVVKALVRNPYALPRITVALIDTLMTPDLKAVAEDTTLHPQVIQCAAELVEERQRGGK